MLAGYHYPVFPTKALDISGVLSLRLPVPRSEHTKRASHIPFSPRTLGWLTEVNMCTDVYVFTQVSSPDVGACALLRVRVLPLPSPVCVSYERKQAQERRGRVDTQRA